MGSADVAALPWIQAIRPRGAPTWERLSRHSELRTWHVQIELARWTIPEHLHRLWDSDEDANTRDTWRKRPLVRSGDAGHPYECGESEVAARLRRAGHRSYWVSEWSGFAHVPVWAELCVKRNELEQRLPIVWSFDRRLRVRAAELGMELGRSGGHPDVVAWKDGGDELVFLEYKGPGDSIKEKQNAWARALSELEQDRVAYVLVEGKLAD